MSLLVDIGNSRVKWAQWRNAELGVGDPFAWDLASLESELKRRWAGLSPPDGVWIVNVGGRDVGERVSDWCRTIWGVAPRCVNSVPRAHGIANLYEDPAQLGADRFVAMIGARQDHRGSFCVVDCGTALTIDAVNAGGEFVGGVIAPGLHLMRRELSRGTHALPYGDEPTDELFPRDTRGGIAAGTRHALAGCIERVVVRYRRELGGDPACVLTGGEAALIRHVLGIPHHYEPHLVLRGLAVIAEAKS